MSVVIQLGSNVGLDSVFDFLSNAADSYSVYLVEPNLSSFEQCKKNYKTLFNKHEIHFLNAAAVPYRTTDEIQLFFPTQDKNSPFASSSKNFVNAHVGYTEIDSFTAKAIPINDLLEIYSIDNNVEYLYIDTEGLCVDIVDAIDFDKYNIKNLIFEYIHSDGTLSWGGPKLADLLEKLMSINYSITRKDYDVVATKI